MNFSRLSRPSTQFTFTRVVALAVVAFSLAAPQIAQAQSNKAGSRNVASSYAPGGSYIGLNAGRSDYALGNGLGVFSSSQGDTSYGINAGAFANDNFGLELGYTDFGKVGRAGGTTKAEGINLSVIGKYPLSDSFNVLAKLGTTYGHTNVSSNPFSGVAQGSTEDFGLSYGVGAEFLATPNWSAVLQYDSHNLKYVGDQYSRIGVTSLGMRYRF